MIIVSYDWWDDWMDGISRCHEILSWWFDPPIVMFYNHGMVVYGRAHHIYDWENMYKLTSNLHQRLEREVKTLVFTTTTVESLS